MPDPFLKRLELGFRHVLIAVLARIARRPRRTSMAPLPPDARILLLRHDRLGDAIVSTATMKLLRERLPNARIEVLLGRRNRAIASLLPAVDDTLVLEKGVRGLRAIARQLRARHYDVVIDLMVKDSSSGALLSTLSGARLRIGFAGALADIYDFAISRPNRPMHIVRQTALLLAPFGIAPLDDAPRREPEMLELQIAAGVAPTARRPMLGRAPRIVFSISARDESHTWPDERIVELECALRGEGYEWSVAGSPEHRSRVEVIAAGSNAIAPLAPTTSFAAFVGALSRFDIIITPQTSTVHVGSALRRPTILLNTSSESDSQWTPWGVPCRVLARGESLSAITVEEVADAVRSLVEELRELESRTVDR